MSEPKSPKVGLSETSIARDRARLVRFQIQVLACPPGESRDLLLSEIRRAQEQLDQGASEYARQLLEQTASLPLGIPRRSWLGNRRPESAVGVVMLGMVTYSVKKNRDGFIYRSLAENRSVPGFSLGDRGMNSPAIIATAPRDGLIVWAGKRGQIYF